MVKIVQKDDPILRKIAEPVGREMLGTPRFRKIVRDIKSTLAREDDGVALAAPQVGVLLRLFVVSGMVMEILRPEGKNQKKKYVDMVFINPKIIKISKEREVLEEGCLSARFLYGKIDRAKKVKIRAMDEEGGIFEMGASGLLAQIFQHETDHLVGRLFLDNAADIREIPPGNTTDAGNTVNTVNTVGATSHFAKQKNHVKWRKNLK